MGGEGDAKGLGEAGGVEWFVLGLSPRSFRCLSLLDFPAFSCFVFPQFTRCFPVLLIFLVNLQQPLLEYVGQYSIVFTISNACSLVWFLLIKSSAST